MPPPNRPMVLMQTLVDGADFSLVKIPTTKVKEQDVTADTFAIFDHSKPIGISPGFSSVGKLLALAIADDKHCTIIEFNVHAPSKYGRDRGKNKPPLPRNLNDLQQKILCRPAGELFAFDMGPLSMSLYGDAELRITNAVDIQSGLSAVDRKPLTAIKEILGTAVSIQEKNVISVFGIPVYDPEDRKGATDLAMRAWISQLLAEYGNGAETLGKVQRIDTAKLSVEKLNMIAKIANDSLRLGQMKPTRTVHSAEVISDSSGRRIIRSATYKNKLRSDTDVRLGIQGPSGTSGYTIPAHVGVVNGKSGLLQAARSVDGDMVMTVISIGRDDPTTAEAQRAATVLRILQGHDQLLTDSPWIQNIFFPQDDHEEPLSWPISWSDPRKSGPSLIPMNPPSVLLQLNSSQQDAVNTMYSTLDEHRITIIHGPPGTGKTSVIASFVQLAIQTGFDGIWLVAQSNVAVKNIAEKLLSAGFMEWKLLVSKDFIFQWHEHIYTKVEDNIIRSDQFSAINPRIIKGCKVMLCTLSMLSNMFISKFTSRNPIKILIVDEASQIEIGNYVSILSTSSSNLRKACFIGDDKQLPPFGQEDLQDLQSIFEIPHLHSHMLFLDTQYRMPPQIGTIISSLVYDGKLKSNLEHPVTDKVIACHFVDIPGHEQLNGNSFMNLLECEAVIKLAWQLQNQQKAYQIISPYEGQRSTIEAQMKDTPGLVWKNKCFNVDSFQGNEEDYIIISLVRSYELGFLTNLRRTNVMLTRCKRGMFIVSSRKFLKGKGASTLVGELEQKMGPEAWLEMKDLEEVNF